MCIPKEPAPITSKFIQDAPVQSVSILMTSRPFIMADTKQVHRKDSEALSCSIQVKRPMKI